jgi:protein-tyrosine phosphatase
MSSTRSDPPGTSSGLSRRRLLTGAATAGAGVLFASTLGRPAFAASAPPPAFPDPVDRFIWVEGAFNTRDFGGYDVGRRQIATGMLWRTSALNNVDANGVATLATLNLGIVADFRSHGEVAGGLDVLPAGVRNIFVPIGDPAPAVQPAGVRIRNMAVTPNDPPPPGGLTQPDPATIAEFQSYITSDEAKSSLGTAIRTLARQHKPFMWHCSSGTYRTGWATTVLLTLLGVDQDDVYSEFLLSNLALGGTYAFSQYLDAAFAEANTVYGSFRRYVHEGLHVSAETEMRLRHRLLCH